MIVWRVQKKLFLLLALLYLPIGTDLIPVCVFVNRMLLIYIRRDS